MASFTTIRLQRYEFFFMTNKNHKKDGAIKDKTPDFIRKCGV